MYSNGQKRRTSRLRVRSDFGREVATATAAPGSPVCNNRSGKTALSELCRTWKRLVSLNSTEICRVNTTCAVNRKHFTYSYQYVVAPKLYLAVPRTAVYCVQQHRAPARGCRVHTIPHTCPFDNDTSGGFEDATPEPCTGYCDCCALRASAMLSTMFTTMFSSMLLQEIYHMGYNFQFPFLFQYI